MLQPEQQDLLIRLVEAERSVPRDRRDAFRVLPSGMNNSWITIHPGLPGGAELIPTDVRQLSREGMIDLRQGKRGYTFDITSAGYEAYETLKLRLVEAADRVQESIRRYIDGPDFQARFPGAYAKWMQAEALLWNTENSARSATEIGHHCREALQEFLTVLLRIHRVEEYDDNVEHTTSRFKSIVAKVQSDLGDSEQKLLDVLVTYLVVVYKWANRQEHGNKEERAELTWHDGRRVVFQTLMVMYEIDQSLPKPR